MCSVRQTKYYKKDLTESWLIENNFSYSKIFSNDEQTIYTHKFPVHKNDCFVSLECEIQIDIANGNIVNTNVYDGGTRSLYAPFYYTEYEDYTFLLKSIHNKILSKFDKLGIQKKRSRRRRHGSKGKKII